MVATFGCFHTGDVRAVREVLGHVNPKMTARCSYVVDMAKKKPVVVLAMKVG